MYDIDGPGIDTAFVVVLILLPRDEDSLVVPPIRLPVIA